MVVAVRVAAAPVRLVMLAEQMTSAPPPLAEPLHCVIVAPLVVAGKGSQPVVMPPRLSPDYDPSRGSRDAVGPACSRPDDPRRVASPQPWPPRSPPRRPAGGR